MERPIWTINKIMSLFFITDFFIFKKEVASYKKLQQNCISGSKSCGKLHVIVLRNCVLT